MDCPDEALSVARQQAQTAAPSAVPFWKLFGDPRLVDGGRRRRGDRVSARLGGGGGNAEVADRLGTLLAARGRTDDLARLAAEAFQKFGAASVLLTGMDAAIEAERWDAARTLASIAAPRRADLEEEPGYWSALGRLAAHDGKPTEAVAAFTKGVALAPSDGALADDLRAARIEAGLDPDPDVLAAAHDRAAEAAGARLATAIERHDRRRCGRSSPRRAAFSP